MNYTRIFTGAYVEPEGAFGIARNTLAPKPGRFIAPWRRSDTPGYADGGNKFDLLAVGRRLLHAVEGFPRLGRVDGT